MNLIHRLRALGLRREAEGIYTDQNICEEAIQEIERLKADNERLWSFKMVAATTGGKDGGSD